MPKKELILVDMFKNFPDVLTVDDLQKALRIGRNSAYRLIEDGQIKCIRVGRAVRIPKSNLLDFVRQTCYTEAAQTGSPC